MKGLGVAFLVGFVVVAILLVGQDEQEASFNSNKVYDPKEEVRSNIELKFSARKAGFGSVMEANFTIINDSYYDIKDIQIRCNHFSKSGTEIDYNTGIIYELFPSGKRRYIKDFNMGFMHSQSASTYCRIEDFVLIPGKKEPKKETPERASTKKEIRCVQEALRTQGFNPGPVDGVYGAKTRIAIQEYEKKSGLAVTGEIGGVILAALRCL